MRPELRIWRFLQGELYALHHHLKVTREKKIMKSKQCCFQGRPCQCRNTWYKVKKRKIPKTQDSLPGFSIRPSVEWWSPGGLKEVLCNMKIEQRREDRRLKWEVGTPLYVLTFHSCTVQGELQRSTWSDFRSIFMVENKVNVTSLWVKHICLGPGVWKTSTGYYLSSNWLNLTDTVKNMSHFYL